MSNESLYDPFNLSGKSEELDMTNYRVRYYFDNMEFLLSDGGPFDPNKVRFNGYGTTEEEVYRYFKTAYADREDFINYVVYESDIPLDDCPDQNIVKYIKEELYPRVIKGYDNAKPYSHEEALQITNEIIRMDVLETLSKK